jgi:UDP-glucose 4-epimerase
MRVLVTGGAGFVGSHVAEAYLRRGDEVWILDDLSTGDPENLPPGIAGFVQASVADAEARRFLASEPFDLVSHHGAQVDARRSLADPLADAHTNVLGLLNLLEGLRDGDRISKTRFILASSGGVLHGESRVRPTPEDAPVQPASPFAVARLSGEFYLDVYRQRHDLDAITLRYGQVYGPRMRPGGEAGVIAIFLQRMLAREPLTLFGDGSQTRDFIHVKDAVAAHLLLGDGVHQKRARSGHSPATFAYNVATGVGTSVITLADLLEAVSGLRVSRNHAPLRPGARLHITLDPGRLHSLGWKPTVSLRDGLQETYYWIRDRLTV